MPSNPLDLAGLSAVVTGASSGIGRAIALEFAAAGADVLIHARRSAAAAERTAAEAQALGVSTMIVLADLADPTARDEFAERAWAWRQGIDLLVNNAGADVLTGEAAAWPFDKKLDALWKVDVQATMTLSRAIGMRMKARGKGAIINMGWDQADHGMAGGSGELFAATKGAVMAFTKSLARSLAPEVRVNCLAPGWIQTKWGQNASDAWRRRAVGESLLGRWGLPEDVARVARFLASPAASFVTGQIAEINGGARGQEWRD
jgi:3-oxoacyl-[acyl-carrier protein] reductase